jgi:hypothetical protein
MLCDVLSRDRPSGADADVAGAAAHAHCRASVFSTCKAGFKVARGHASGFLDFLPSPFIAAL